MKTLLLGDLSPTEVTSPYFKSKDLSMLFNDAISIFENKELVFVNLECALTDHDVAINKLNDLIGVRVVCLYQDDLYEFADLLTTQKDLTLLKSKDYIKSPKKSGYRSLHLILEVPICLNTKIESMKIEVQLRTVPMDCWSVLDYQLCYKKPDKDITNVKEKLKKHSEIIEELDQEMMLLRNEIEQII